MFSVIPDCDIIIDKWEENRDACLQNDAARNRQKNSVSTILNATYTLDLSALQSVFPDKRIKIQEHEIVLASKFKIDAAMHGAMLEDDRYLISSSWVTGGHLGNYMNDDVESLDPESQPTVFSELSSFLLEVCPSVTLKQYLDILKDAVSIGPKTEYGYYNSVTNYAYFKADLELIYEILEL